MKVSHAQSTPPLCTLEVWMHSSVQKLEGEIVGKGQMKPVSGQDPGNRPHRFPLCLSELWQKMYTQTVSFETYFFLKSPLKLILNNSSHLFILFFLQDTKKSRHVNKMIRFRLSYFKSGYNSCIRVGIHFYDGRAKMEYNYAYLNFHPFSNLNISMKVNLIA